MTMRIALTLLAAGLLFSCGGADRTPEQIHTDALVVDLHSDTPMRMTDGFDISQRDSTGHMDIPRLRDGGVDLQVFACFVSTRTPLEECPGYINEMIDSIETQVDANADDLGICHTAAEAERLVGEGKIAVFLGIENGVAIADSLELLQHYYDRGVRYMTLTHTASNDWCISSADTAEAFYGLTDFGRDVVRKMNELGMIVDVSHASPSAVDEVLKVTTDPVIASHSCVHALCDHDRNLTDAQIKAIAANGGVIGINFYTGYLSQRWNTVSDSLFAERESEIDSLRELYQEDREKRWEALRPIYQAVFDQIGQLVTVDVGTVVDHIDYIVKLVGPDYVGFGSDFDGVGSLPVGLSDCSMMPNITRELVRRGYTEDDIGKILGGNFMRVFRQVCDS